MCFFVHLDGPLSLDSGDLSKDEGTSYNLSHLGALGNHLQMMVNPDKSGKPGSTVSKVTNTDMNLCNSGFFMAGESNMGCFMGIFGFSHRYQSGFFIHKWRKC